MEVKPWYQSRTIWLNALYLLVTIASTLGLAGFTPDQRTVETTNAVVAILNVLLRFRTNQSVGA